MNNKNDKWKIIDKLQDNLTSIEDNDWLHQDVWLEVDNQKWLIVQALDIKEFDEETYFNDLLELLSVYNSIKDDKIKSSWDHVDHEFESGLTYSIWSLNNSINLPPEYKYLVKETRQVVRDVEKSNWKFRVWLNTYLVPWSLSSIRKLMDTDVLDANNINIDLWHWVNMQEGIRIVKHTPNWHPGWVTYFDPEKDKLEKISIKLWENSSVAHSTVFQSRNLWDNNLEYTLETWENVFLWINSQIGSWVKIWSNTTIWWGTKINNDVNIWSNVVLWQWVTIENWINIPDNCLVPNWAIIKEWFEILPFEEYIQDEINFDTRKTGEKKRRSFIIKLSDDLELQRKQMNDINKDYGAMADFNVHHVTPENKLFAVLNTLLAIIEKHFPEAWILKELEFKSALSLDKLKQKLPTLDEEFLKRELDRPVKLVLKAFPKDKENFITVLIPKIIEFIQSDTQTNNDREKLIKEIKGNLDYPKISEDKMYEVFLWTNMFTWRAKIDEKSLVFDTSIRSDELWYNDKVKINNSTILKWVIHGWWNKIINHSNILSTVVHWNIDINHSTIWNIKHHSIFHNSNLDKVEQKEWWIVANGTTINDSVIWYDVLLMPFSNIQESIIWNSSIIWGSNVVNIIVHPNSFIWNWLNFDSGSDKANPWMISGMMHNQLKPRDWKLVSSLSY